MRPLGWDNAFKRAFFTKKIFGIGVSIQSAKILLVPTTENYFFAINYRERNQEKKQRTDTKK